MKKLTYGMVGGGPGGFIGDAHRRAISLDEWLSWLPDAFPEIMKNALLKEKTLG